MPNDLNTVHRLDPYQIRIHLLRKNENPPMNLLLLADPSEAIIAGYVKRGSCWVAEGNDGVIGVYTLLETRPQTVELVNLAVKEEAQRHGIGKRLVLHAVETAREAGFQVMEIGTGNSSFHQLRLYQQCGFRIVGVDPDFFVRHYNEPIYENGLQCRDMIRLKQEL